MQRRGGTAASDMHVKQRRQAAAPDTDTEFDSATGPESGIDSGDDTDGEQGPAPPTTAFRSRNVKTFNGRRAVETSGSADFTISSPPPRRSLGRRTKSSGSKHMARSVNRRQETEAEDADTEFGSALDVIISSPPPRRSTLRRRINSSSSKQIRGVNRRQAAGATDTDSGIDSATDGVDSATDGVDSATDDDVPAAPRQAISRRRATKGLSGGVKRRQAVGAPVTDTEADSATDSVDSATDGVNSATDDDVAAPAPRQAISRRRTTKSLSGGVKRRQAVGAPATDTEADSATDGVDSATDNDVDSATDDEQAPPPATVARRSPASMRAKRVDSGHFNRRQDDIEGPPSDPESESGSEDEGQDTVTNEPSPTETAEPTGVSGPTDGPNGAIDVGRIGTEEPDNGAPTKGPAETAFPSKETADLNASPAQAQQQEIGQPGDQPGGMGRAGVIAMGVLSKSYSPVGAS